MLNHLHLPARDLARSVAFYAEWFDFRPLNQSERFVRMRNAEAFLLILEACPDISALPLPFHFGFESPSEDILKSLWARLSEAGVSMVQDLTDKDGLLSFRCADPTGHVIEVYLFRSAE